MASAARYRDTAWQLLRYAAVGAAVTSIYTAVFVLLDSFSHATLQLCNVAGYAVSVVVGYVLHSRVTFRNQGRRGRGSQLRFALATVPSYALNAFWAWLIGTKLGWPHWMVQLPVWFVTPFLIFAINRWWVFR